MSDDDFFLNDDELAADNQPSIVQLAEDKVLSAMLETIKDMKNSIKLNESSECHKDIEKINNYSAILAALDAISDANLSDEEIEEKVNEALKTSTEITFSNMDNIASLNTPKDLFNDDDKDEESKNKPNGDDGTTNSSLDF